MPALSLVVRWVLDKEERPLGTAIADRCPTAAGQPVLNVHRPLQEEQPMEALRVAGDCAAAKSAAVA